MMDTLNSNPLAQAFGANLKAYDRVARSSQPVLKTMTRAQIEAGGFVTKRMKAHMDLPSRMAKCQTPMDVMAAGMQFWVECFEDYAETSQRALQIMGVAAPMPLSRISDWQPVKTASGSRERDVMDLTDAPDAATQTRHPGTAAPDQPYETAA